MGWFMEKSTYFKTFGRFLFCFFLYNFGIFFYSLIGWLHSNHGLRTPREEIAFTARPKIQSQSQIFRYGQSIFCLPQLPNFSDIFYLCLHWESAVREFNYCNFVLPIKIVVCHYWVHLTFSPPFA